MRQGPQPSGSTSASSGTELAPVESCERLRCRRYLRLAPNHEGEAAPPPLFDAVVVETSRWAADVSGVGEPSSRRVVAFHFAPPCARG